MVRKTSMNMNIGIICLICSFAAMILSGCNKPEPEKLSEKDPVLLATGHDSIDPPPPDLHKAALVNVELGIGYLQQGQTARAKSKFTHAIKLAPTAYETHAALAYYLEQVGDYKESEKEHHKAIKYGSTKGAVYNNYGAFLCRRGKLQEADKEFHKALLDKEYERTAEVYENAGICALKGTDMAVAENYLKTALMRDPKRSVTMLELAALNLRQGRLAEARRYSATAYGFLPDQYHSGPESRRRRFPHHQSLSGPRH